MTRPFEPLPSERFDRFDRPRFDTGLGWPPNGPDGRWEQLYPDWPGPPSYIPRQCCGIPRWDAGMTVVCAVCGRDCCQECGVQCPRCGAYRCSTHFHCSCETDDDPQPNHWNGGDW